LNSWASNVGTTLGTLLLIPVALRAAASLSNERERQTLDSLLTCPVSNYDILWSKWWGTILRVRYGMVLLGVVWVLGVMTGGLHWLALPLLCLTWLAHASLVTGLGLWFSLVCASTLRATLLTVLALLAFNALPYSLGTAVRECLYWLKWGSIPVWLGEFENGGLALPVNLWQLSSYSFRPGQASVIDQQWFSALVSLGCVSGSAFGLWCLIRARFGPVTGRMAGARTR
jgi:hypothetical protein